MKKETFHNILAILFTFIACFVLLNLHLEPKTENQSGTKEKARVLETDNSSVQTIGLVTQGTQALKVKVLTGQWKGQTFSAMNQLRAQMDLDKIFEPGDTALVAVYDGATPETGTLNAQDYYRIDWIVLLFGLFALLLVIFAGITGFKSFMTFILSCLVVWKLMVPLCLRGMNPLLISTITVTLLTAVIIYLVAGFNRKGTTAFTGAILGVLASCFLAWICTKLFHINGATQPYSQALLYSGYHDLNLANIYIGAIFIGSSGAVMDLGMDVAAGMSEVAAQNEKISHRELVMSGIRIGRSVVGTMTTTLLLAYSGGYLTLMMTFMAQGTAPYDFVNNPHVASEIVKTIVGSFGLVLVAPFTALMGGFLLKRKLPSEKCIQ